MTKDEIQERRKWYKRWWYESLYSGRDMDVLLDELEQTQDEISQLKKELAISVVENNIYRHALEEICDVYKAEGYGQYLYEIAHKALGGDSNG